MTSNKLVLVTGGSGYVAGRLIPSLQAAGMSVRVGSRMSSSSVAKRYGPLIQHVHYDAGSISCDLEKLLTGVDSVVHLAAMDAPACQQDPKLAYEVNVAGTVRLIEACNRQKVKRLVYISTLHVFGTPLIGRLTENKVPKPNHPYGTTHAEAETKAIEESTAQATTVIRLSNAFGPPHCEPSTCWQLVVNSMCRQAVSKGEVVLKSNGSQLRDFVPMTNVIEGVKLVLELPVDRANGIFHIGSGQCMPLRQVAQWVVDRAQAILGTRPQLIFGSKIEESFPFEFSTTKVLQSAVADKNSIVSEIDACLLYCVNQPPNNW